MTGSRKLALAGIGLAVVAAVFGWTQFFSGTQTEVVQAEAAGAEAPLLLARQGHFYAGGKYDDANPNRHIIGAMYVEYKIPAELRHPFPIVMVHGGGVHGASWYTTPNGREGWAPYFLRRGYAVYVVDQVARGRSVYIADYGPARTQTLEYMLQRFAASEKYNLWPQAKTHTQWPGKAEPGDPVFDAYFASNIGAM